MRELSLGYSGAMRAAFFYALLLTFVAAERSEVAQSMPAAPAAAPSAQAPATDAPRVRLVATGGTISNRNGGRLTAEELVKSMPGIERYAQAEFEQFTNLASSELTLDQWLGLSKRLNELVK